MATHKATLAKKNNEDEIEYIFPRTTADLVKYSEDKSVADKIDELSNNIGVINTDDFYNKLEIEDLLYTPLNCMSLTGSPSKVERGATESIKIEWIFNKIPTAFAINGDNVTPSAVGSVTFNNIHGNQSFNIVASDNGSASHESTTIYKTINITLCDAIYYGVTEIPESINSNFINGLSNKYIQNNSKCTFTINVENNQYVWFACPEGYDTSFYVNGFKGGFILADTIEFTNAYGSTISYKVYKSQYNNLGNISVEVK